MPQARPNIVLIITDQQRFDTIAALGYPFMQTPCMDRLIHEGTAFTNCFVTSPSCAPSRGSVFTGYYPHTTGIYKNADIWRHSWVEKLAESGYYCTNIGKMHTFPYETPAGFQERFVVENKDRYLEGRYFFDRWDLALQAQGLVKQQRELYRKHDDYRDRLGAFTWNLPAKTHPDNFVGDLAVWWIENKPQTEPLFLQIGFPGPHPPFDPLPEFVRNTINLDLPLPDATNEELARQPEALKKLREHNCEVDHDSIVWQKNPTREQLHRMRAHYYANVAMIDAKIGQIITALEQKKYLENTVIILTSDHGDNLGDHGQIEKWNMFDEVTRVPLVVWAPWLFQGNRKIDCLCQNFDIAPVILELAGIAAPESFEARSLAPVLNGQASDCGRNYVFSEVGKDIMLFDDVEQMTMVRDRQWKLVHYLNKDYGELYNLVRDPGEKVNLWQEAGLGDKKQELLGEILNWSLRSGLKAANWKAAWR